jgi:hypothetical protein
MGKVFTEPIIGLQGIAIEIRTDFDMIANKRLKFWFAASAYHFGADLAATLHSRCDDSLTFRPAPSDLPRPFGLVHVTGFNADEGFVYLFITAKLAAGLVILHRKSNSVKHEPRGFLSDTDSAVDLPGRNAVLAIANHPDGGQPLVKAKRRVLKDSPDLDAELSPVMFFLALPPALVCKKVNASATTSRAGYAMQPSARYDVVQAVVSIGKILNGFDEGGWAFHTSTIPEKPSLVKYIVTKYRAR